MLCQWGGYGKRQARNGDAATSAANKKANPLICKNDVGERD
jgi:hypothetical protein